MFFRFGGALILLVVIALAGIAIEKRSLELRRAVSHQNFRQEVLLEEHAQNRLKAQQLGAPARLMGDLPVPEAIPKSGSVKNRNQKTTKKSEVEPRFIKPGRQVRSLPPAMLDEDFSTN